MRKWRKGILTTDRRKIEAYQSRTANAGKSKRSDIGTTAAVCSGRLRDGGLIFSVGGAGTAAYSRVGHVCGGDSVFVRTGLRGAFCMRMISLRVGNL